MPKVWDYSRSAYENEKQNIIATRSSQNRFGKKFRRLFNRHKEVNPEGKPVYGFKEGMFALFEKVHVQEQIDEVTELIDSFDMFATSAAGNTFSLDDTLQSAFVTVRFGVTDADWYTDSNILLRAYEIVVTSTLDAADDDKRKKSFIIDQNTIGDDYDVLVDPLEDAATETFGAHLYTADGTEYGHYVDPPLPAGTVSQDLPLLFAVDAAGENNPDGNPIFKDALQADFDAKRDLFEKYLRDYLQSTQYYNETLVLGNILTDTVMLLSLGQYLDYIKDVRDDLIAFHDADPQSERAKDDLEMIRFMRLEKSLEESITKPHKIKAIYFRFQKECTMPDSGVWQEAKELKRVRKVRKLAEHTIVSDPNAPPGAKFTVWIKDSFLTLPSWQVALVVQTFMEIKVKVKKKWYQTGIFKLLTTILAIALIIITDNPVWLKVLLVTATVASSAGIGGSGFQTVVAVVAMAYGAYNADFAAMSDMEIFSFAIKNISMSMQIAQMYEQRSIAAQYARRQRAIEEYATSRKQEEAMRFIYTDGYDEYSTFYEMLYRY